ncbi:glypican-5-like isoform X1 [Pyrgilauda ruficollis]|uniref:glypican-5-like isoform X1 n=1 Tax=Pyrgilauda ruficollis TaxID=221976 RepID=UPI001B86C907|nr:glypican-5-like isoform X1 [Pyrgilauda ruficollis]
MAAGGSRAVLGLWLLAAGLCGAVAAGRSPSCHEVRTAFQLRQIGPLKLVPDVPTAESDLQICQHRAPTCCTKKMEESYQAAVRRERTQSIQALNFELKYMIVGHITAFQEAFESLLRFAENRTSSLFETAYRPMAKEAAEPVKELFTDISLYILGAETTVESAVLRFFDSLFPLVYSRLINPGITDLSEDYTECLRLTRQDINPFGHYSKNMVTELSKSLWASRMLSQALSLGIEVINSTEHAALSKECSRALVKMQYCPHCQGLTLIRPCVGYCLNVMRGCLASVAELDAQWREFISTLEYLTNEMAASHELETALAGIWSSVNEAILHAQLNGPQLSATVDKVCGQPKQQEGNLSSASIVPVREVTGTQTFVMAHTSLNNRRSSLPLKASKNDKSRSLKKISREFISYMKRSRTFYASIAERLCDGDLVMRDSSTCWNGEDVVESYTSRVVSNGLKAQINNPELKVRGFDPLIKNLIDKLQHFNQLDAEKAKLKLERWGPRDAGSGAGRSEEMESSGDCDDEDGCQGSGDRMHTADILKDKKTHPENRNEPKPTMKKIDTTTTTSTVKSSSKHSVAGSGSSPALSPSLAVLAALAVVWHCPL